MSMQSLPGASVSQSGYTVEMGPTLEDYGYACYLGASIGLKLAGITLLALAALSALVVGVMCVVIGVTSVNPPALHVGISLIAIACLLLPLAAFSCDHFIHSIKSEFNC